MRTTFGFMRQNFLPDKLRLRTRLIGPPGLLIAAAMIFASCDMRYRAPIDRDFTQIKKLIASDGARISYFGRFVAINGNTAIVAAAGEDQTLAYIFERDKGGANNWGEVKKLADHTGRVLSCDSMAIYGDIAIVGADGSAYIFERNRGGADNWGEVKKLTAPDGEKGDGFGFSVAICENLAVVGAVKQDIGSDYSQDSAYIFERNQGGADDWGLVKKLIVSDGNEGARFGRSVAIYGNLAIVGAYEDAIGNNPSQGSAYIFERNKGGANNWGEVKKLLASDGEQYAYFGYSVAIYGNLAIVGAFEQDIGGNENQGSAYVFGRNQGGADNWGEVKRLTASDSATRGLFGKSVAIYEDTAIVGAPAGTVGSNLGQGSAYIFGRNQGGADNWGEVKKLTASDGKGGDFFGESVAIYGDMAIAGAPGQNIGRSAATQGAAYIFSPKTPGR